MRSRIPRLSLLILALSFGLAQAEVLSVRPGLVLSERYDSNVLNAPHGSESSDFVTRANPTATVSLDLFSTRLSLVGGLDAEWYDRHDELNELAMTRNFDLSAGDPLRVTPRLTIRPAARYVESRDAVRRNQLTRSAVPGLAPADTQVTARTGTREYSGALHASYAVTPNLDAGAGIGAVRKSFFDGAASLVGSNTYTADLNAGYRVSPNLTLGVYGNAAYDEFDNRNDVRNLSGGLSANYRLSPATTLDVRAGVTHIRADDLPEPVRKPSGRFDLARRSPDVTVSLHGSVDYAAGSFGSETRREDVTLRFDDRVTEAWSWDTAGTWQANRSVNPPYVDDLMSVQWSAGIRYAFARYAKVSLTGELFRQWNRGGRGSDIYRESALLGFELGSDFPLF